MQYKYLSRRSRRDIVIFDECNHELLLPLLDGYDYWVLRKIDTRYFNAQIILFFISGVIKKYIHKKRSIGLGRLYFSSVLSFLLPKTVVTYIDNCPCFSFLHQSFPDITFVALQNGGRTDAEWIHVQNPYDLSNSISADHYFCFGQYEKDYFRERKANLNNTYKLGSLRLNNFCSLYEKNKFSLKNDILYLSCWTPNSPSHQFYFLNLCFLKLDEMLAQALRSSSYTIAIALRTGSELERAYFIKLFGEKTIFIQRSNNLGYETYASICESSLVIGHGSTLLLESLYLNKKILNVDLTPERNMDYFSQVNTGLNQLKELVCFYDSCANLLKRKVDELLGMGNIEYQDLIRGAKDYFMSVKGLDHYKKELKNIIEANNV